MSATNDSGLRRALGMDLLPKGHKNSMIPPPKPKRAILTLKPRPKQPTQAQLDLFKDFYIGG